jgi:thymidylate synthase (FAD)
MDKFRLHTLRSTPSPQQLVWAAMHQDYSEDLVYEQRDRFPEEAKAGELIVKHLLAGNRGHYGCLEAPQITFNAGYFPHSTMQQLRTHRIGISMDVQSGRYTSKRIIDVCTGDTTGVQRRNVEEVFYLRPIGNYTNRQGKSYFYSEEQRSQDLAWCLDGCKLYKQRIDEGVSEEHARGIIPFDIRQHFVITCNARSLMHLLDLRWKKDAQLECQKFCDLLFAEFQDWMPSVASWYQENRAKKARLAP